MGAVAGRDLQKIAEMLRAHERFVARDRGGNRAVMHYANLSRLDLSKRNLTEIDLTGANLTRAILTEAILDRAALFCVNLQNADLRRARLRRVDLRGSSLRGANFSLADLDGADLRAGSIGIASPEGDFKVHRQDDPAQARPVSFAGGKLNGAKLENADAASVDFSNCVMKRVNFGAANLKGANFQGALLQGATFTQAKLADANFSGAVLTGLNVKDLPLTPAQLKSCVLEPGIEARARLPELTERVDAAVRWVESGGTSGKAGVFDGEDLRLVAKVFKGKALTAISAKRVLAVGADFSGCQLQGAHFDGADLRDAIFENADLKGVSFKGANLTNAAFKKCDLRSLMLETGDPVPADFSEALLVQTLFCDVVRDPESPNGSSAH